MPAPMYPASPHACQHELVQRIGLAMRCAARALLLHALMPSVPVGVPRCAIDGVSAALQGQPNSMPC